MKKLLFILFAILSIGISQKASAYDFSAVNSDGRTFWYNITSSTSPYTVEIVRENQDYYYSCYGGDIIIPSYVSYNNINYSVTSIGAHAFRHCYNVTSVSIPNSITNIGDYAFNSVYISTINIPNSITSIGHRVFDNCIGLSSIVIPNSITSIGEKAFFNCKSLKSIHLPNGLVSIGDLAFCQCNTLKSIIIPSYVKHIGKGAFMYCQNISSFFVFPNNTHHRSENGVLFSFNLDTLISYPLAKTDSIYTVPNSVHIINDKAFAQSKTINRITIGNSVSFIGEDCFSGCIALDSIYISNSVKSIGYAAFSHCYSLSSVIIPDSVIAIEGYTFATCSNLKTLTIGKSVSSISWYAFSRCENLSSITSLPETPPSLIHSSFDAVPRNIPLYVPCGTAETYQNTPLWEDFTNIINCIGITSIEDNNIKISIYPNPAKDNITIKTNQLNGGYLFLYDIMGKEVLRKTISGDETFLDISNLKSGIYVLKVLSKDNSIVENRKIIKH